MNLDSNKVLKIIISITIVAIGVYVVVLATSKYTTLVNSEIAAKEHLELGLKYFEEEQYEKALQELLQISKETEAYSEAVAYIEQAIGPYSLDIMNRCDELLGKEEYAEAYDVVYNAIRLVGETEKFNTLAIEIEEEIVKNVTPLIDASYDGELIEGQSLDVEKILLNYSYLERIYKKGTVVKTTPTEASTYGEVIFNVYYSEDEYVEMKVNVISRLVELKAEYIGESIDARQSIDRKNINVIGVYSDSSTKVIEEYELSSEILERIGANNITITKDGITCVLTINALAPLVSLEVTYIGKDLYIGDTLSKTDFGVVAVYADGARKQISDFSLSATNILSESSTVKITYNNIVGECNLTAKSTSIVVDKLSVRELSIKANEKKESSIDNAQILSYSGNIVSEEQVDKYNFTPAYSGEHRIELNDTTGNYSIEVRSENGTLVEDGICGNGSGVTVDLKSGKTYKVKVSYYNSVNKYTINIGVQKVQTDISCYSKIIDCIQYEEQINIYTYVPTTSGIHRFELSDTIGNYSIEVRSENGTLVKDGICGNGSGVTAELKSGKTYRIKVSHYNSINSYKLCIWKQKENVDISRLKSIEDSIEYVDQKNIYTFDCPSDKEYSLYLTNTSGNYDISIYNSNGTLMESKICGNGSTVTVTLAAGKRYTIKVSYYNSLNDYALEIY